MSVSSADVPSGDSDDSDDDSSKDSSMGSGRDSTAGSGSGDGSGHSSGRLARSSALMASGTLVSRILGFVRVMLLAGALGLLSSPAGNAWQTANTLPNSIYLILAGGVLNVIFVPSLTRAMARDDGGRDFSDRLITLALGSLLGITIVVTLFASVLTQFYALSWSGDQLALAVAFAYLCLPQVFFYGLYTVLGQVLNSMEKFGWYTWAPVANNIVAIGGLVIFTQLYPEAGQLGPGAWTASMIWWLAGTATLGVATQAFVLIWPLKRAGFQWRPRWGFRGVGLGDASRLALWTLAVIAVSQFAMWISTNLLNRATTLQGDVPGRIVYETAFLFFNLPHAIVTYSLVTAMFTQLSRTAAVNDLPAMRSQVSQGMRLLGVTMVPISLGMVALIPAITAVLLPSNTLQETTAVAYVAMPLLLGLAPYAVYTFANRVFFAYQDGKTPFLMQLIITGVSLVVLAVVWFGPPALMAVGVSAAQSLGQTFAAVASLWFMARKLRGMRYGAIGRTYTRALVASLVALIPTAVIGYLAISIVGGRGAGWAALFIGGPIYFLVYALVANRLGVTELREAAEPLLRRLGRGSQLGLGSQETPVAAPGPQTEGLPPSSATAADPPQAAFAVDEDPLHDRRIVSSVDQTPVRKESALQGIDAGLTLGQRYVLEELLAQRDEDLDYWSARDNTLDRLVAVTIVPATGEYEELAHHVQDGARRTAGVDDPRLVRVLDMGIDDGICWIVEEGLAEAESLASLVSAGQLPAEEARRIIGEAASGLEAARRRGLHHLFLSPHTVLRTREGNIKVSGVAVAAAIEQVEDIGSAQASIIDTSDLVSLLYTALTRHWPGEDMDGIDAAPRRPDGALPAPSERVGGVPGDLDALCRQVLAENYDPRTGPRTPGQLAQQLAPWASDIVTDPATENAAPAGPTDPAGAGAIGGAAAGGAGAARSSDGDITDSHAIFRPEPTQGPAASAAAGAAGGSAADSGATAPGRPDGQPGAPSSQTGGDAAASAYSGPRSQGGFGDPYEDEYQDEQYFAPDPREDRTGSNRLQSLAVLLVVLGIVLGAGYLVYSMFLSGDDDTETADPPPVTADPTDAATQTATPTEPEEPEEPEETWVIGDPLTLADVQPFDTNGYAERVDIVGWAWDGEPDTAWNSHTYLAANWGGLKTGVGLLVDLGDTVPVGEVTVTFPQGDYGAQVYIADSPVNTEAELAGLPQLGSSSNASGEWTVAVADEDDIEEGQYVVIWFDRAWDGPGGEIVYVSDIEVKSIDFE